MSSIHFIERSEFIDIRHKKISPTRILSTLGCLWLCHSEANKYIKYCTHIDIKVEHIYSGYSLLKRICPLTQSEVFYQTTVIPSSHHLTNRRFLVAQLHGHAYNFHLFIHTFVLHKILHPLLQVDPF